MDNHLHNLGNAIRNGRKLKQLSQEELAGLLGVSAAAVSKWECGKTYPDITLLPALAQQLNTSLDALFNFSGILEDSQTENIIEQFVQTIENKGFAAALEFMEQQLAKYPHSAILQLSFGSMLALYYKRAPEEEHSSLLQRSIALCLPALQSPDPKWKATAQEMLTSLYLMSGKLDLAEQSLAQYTDTRGTGVQQAQAVLYSKKGDTAKAKETYQKNLFIALAECENALIGLSGLAYTAKDEKLYSELLQNSLQLSALFGLSSFPGKTLHAYYSLMHFYALKQDTEQTLWAMEGVLACLQSWGQPFNYQSNPMFNTMQQNKTPAFSSVTNSVVEDIITACKSYSFIQQNTFFQSLLEQLKQLSTCS